MKKIILLIVLGALAWQGYGKYSRRSIAAASVQEVVVDEEVASTVPVETTLPTGASFACDGRTYCSQMKSCKEAKYFLQHCPNVKMDGDNDGIPCERQLCQPGQ